MLRVFSTVATRNTIKSLAAFPTFAAAQRFYTPPAEAVKLYQSNFTSGPFPVECATSETAQYAQFLFKLNGDQGQYLKDFDALKKLKLPVFWERSGNVNEMNDLVKATSANFIFTLRWMQIEGNLELLEEVLQYYETLVQAQKKRMVVKVYTSSTGSKDSKVQTAAKALVLETLKCTPALQSRSSWTLDYTFHIDDTIPAVDGFYAEFAGYTVSTIEQTSGDKLSSQATEIDFTSVKAMKSLQPTKWEDNIETDVLRSYYDQLGKLDIEEQMLGV